MGYYKNLEIALQVEEPDRIPEPKPASSHVAYHYGETRKTILEFEKTIKKAKKVRDVKLLLLASGLLGTLGVVGWLL